jgi:hypothetical protein
MPTIKNIQDMTTDDFDRHLAEVIDADNRRPSDLLQIPGVYEVLSEHYNNDVIDAWAAEVDANEED